MRASCRTYELFEIARLILGKPERCVVVLRRRAAEGVAPDAPRGPLAISVPTGLPFDTEEEAVNYTLEKGLDQFFTSETVEVEPPKGSYQFVNRCPVTKDLLGPPNYHRYAQIVQQHYTTRGIRVPFENYKASIEVVRDPDAVTRWLESMKKVTRFTFKGELPAGEQGVFDNLDDARAFLLRTCRDRIVRPADSARVGAKVVEAAPTTEAFRAMSGAVDMQRRFPLDTANALRGRLRRENFNIFKRGSKGVTYVCSVRRKFRQPGQTFSDSINSLIEFLDQNPMVAVSELAPKLLGFAAPPPPPTPAPAAAPAAPAAEANVAAAPPADAPAPIPAETSEPEGPTPEQRTLLNRLMLDLRWLVTEGYVAEYSDGRLVAHPVMTPQAQAQAERAERSGESVPDHLPDPTTTPAASAPVEEETSPAPVEAPAAEPAPVEEPPPSA
jgi:hypothetical protein